MINIDYRDTRPIYEQIKDEFKKMIVHSLLKKDDKIPPVRELAAQLAINPNTIQRAYKELEAEGFIYSVKGRGTFVCDAIVSHNDEQSRKLISLLESTVDELLYVGFAEDELIEIIKERSKKR